MKLLKVILERITHDLLNPLGSMDMLLSCEDNNVDLLKSSLRNSIDILDLSRHMLNENLKMEHVFKLISKYDHIKLHNALNSSLNSTIFSKMPNIILIFTLATINKHKTYDVYINNTGIQINIELNHDEIDGLYKKELSSYSCYFYLISELANNCKINYDNNEIKILQLYV